jgi:hypothetical protein
LPSDINDLTRVYPGFRKYNAATTIKKYPKPMRAAVALCVIGWAVGRRDERLGRGIIHTLPIYSHGGVASQTEMESRFIST